MTQAWNRRRALQAVAAFGGAALLGAAAAKTSLAWPQKPIKLVVTFPPGGSSDIVARLLAPKLAEQLGQPVVIENKPGAGSSLGALSVAQSTNDGYTLLVSNSAALSIAPHLLSTAPYHPIQSFEHLAYIGAVPTVFVAHPSVPVQSFEQLVSWLQSQKNPVAFGSGGAASVGHLIGEQLAQRLKVPMQHIPYRGAGPMRSDLLGGQIQLAVDALPQNLPLLKSGQLKALAVTSQTRAVQAPQVPSIAELGYPELVSENYVGISAPAGLPADVAVRIAAAVRNVCALADVNTGLQQQGFVIQDMDPATFTQLVKQQFEGWKSVAQQTGASL
jgi:tripartite-type tricarboxylate transporter receptor subunit TctC